MGRRPRLTHNGPCVVSRSCPAGPMRGLAGCALPLEARRSEREHLMMANPVGERRRHERVPCAASVACCPFTSSGEIIWYGRTEDVSGGGIRLVVGRRFRRGTVLRLVLRGRAEEA